VDVSFVISVAAATDRHEFSILIQERRHDSSFAIKIDIAVPVEFSRNDLGRPAQRDKHHIFLFRHTCARQCGTSVNTIFRNCSHSSREPMKMHCGEG